MDSQPMLDDSWLIDIVDSEWRNDKLPSEDIQVPIENTIDPENSENEGNSAKDQENKWLDLAVMNRHIETENLNTSSS